MSRRNPTDLSIGDLVQRLCGVCGITAAQLADPQDFPGPDYRDADGAPFWQAETVRAWVQAHAWAEILSRPQEIEELAALLLAVRKWQRLEPLSPGAARVKTLHHFVNARTKVVMGS